jgi:hypothetical protein
MNIIFLSSTCLSEKYICTYVCMYACMYVWMYVQIHKNPSKWMKKINASNVCRYIFGDSS